jgi:DNA-directed RNA polymerase I and III subunit RPAC2
MSVNEVKLQKAPEAFVVRGTGPASSRTFCLGDEDHTLGNAVRQIRVQTVAPRKGQDPPTAADTLKEACQTLHTQCDIVLEKLEEVLPEVRDDRIRMEKLFLEEDYIEDDGNDDDEEPMEGVDETEIKLDDAMAE